MNENEISRARQYIQNGDYRRARILLERHKGKPYADDLLRQIDRLEYDDSPFQRPVNDYSTRQNSPTITQAPQITIQNIIQNNVSAKGLPAIPFFIVTMSICIFSVALLYKNSESPESFATVGTYLCFGIFGAYFVFLLLWRAFWWTLAILSVMALGVFFTTVF